MKRRVGLAFVLGALVGTYAAILRAQQTPTARSGHSAGNGPSARGCDDGAAASGETAALQRALLAHLTLGSGVHVRHCRNAHGGCAARVRRMAALFVRAGRDHNVDPWLLAAIALRESGGNPDAVGARGETGLLQLNPRSRAGRLAARLCAERLAECPAILVDGAARVLRACVDRCGSVESGLGCYHRGVCGADGYARSVIARRERLAGGGA